MSFPKVPSLLVVDDALHHECLELCPDSVHGGPCVHRPVPALAHQHRVVARHARGEGWTQTPLDHVLGRVMSDVMWR